MRSPSDASHRGVRWNFAQMCSSQRDDQTANAFARRCVASRRTEYARLRSWQLQYSCRCLSSCWCYFVLHAWGSHFSCLCMSLFLNLCLSDCALVMGFIGRSWMHACISICTNRSGTFQDEAQWSCASASFPIRGILAVCDLHLTYGMLCT